MAGVVRASREGAVAARRQERSVGRTAMGRPLHRHRYRYCDFRNFATRDRGDRARAVRRPAGAVAAARATGRCGHHLFRISRHRDAQSLSRGGAIRRPVRDGPSQQRHRSGYFHAPRAGLPRAGPRRGCCPRGLRFRRHQRRSSNLQRADRTRTVGETRSEASSFQVPTLRQNTRSPFRDSSVFRRGEWTSSVPTASSTANCGTRGAIPDLLRTEAAKAPQGTRGWIIRASVNRGDEALGCAESVFASWDKAGSRKICSAA